VVGEYVRVIPIVLTIVASTAAGAWAEERWGGRAAAGARRGLLLVLYTVLPFVIFFNLARVELDADLRGGIVLAWVALAVASATAWAVGRFALRLERPEVGSMILATLVSNAGFLGFPLVVALLGADQLGQAVVYDTLVNAPALLLAGFATGAAFGIRAGEGARERAGAFLTRNPPLYAAIAGLIAPASLAPDVLVDASHVFVIAMLPIAFFAVGANLAEESDEGRLRVPPPLSSPVATVIVTRMAIAPGLLLLLGMLLIDLPAPYLLLAAMPCGINVMVVAHAYGLSATIAAEALAWTTLIALAGVLLSQAL
jgi:predicted permease